MKFDDRNPIFFTEVIKFYWLMLLLYSGEL
jgi:hypothetical protein